MPIAVSVSALVIPNAQCFYPKIAKPAAKSPRAALVSKPALKKWLRPSGKVMVAARPTVAPLDAGRVDRGAWLLICHGRSGMLWSGNIN